MNCLNSSLSEDGAVAGAVAGAGVGARDTTGVSVEVLLLLVRTAPASLSLPAGGAFRQGLQRAGGLAIALTG